MHHLRELLGVWQAGPIDFDLTGAALPAPREGPHRQSVGIVRVRCDKRQLRDGAPPPKAEDHGIACLALGAERYRFARDNGAFLADVDFSDETASYQGEIDVQPHGAMPVFESFLRALSSGWLLRRGGALLHASSAAISGQGYLFAGVSGAGKTTLVEGTRDEEYLSDDQSILCPDPATGELEVWGSPFSGLAARRAVPYRVPLRAFVVLERTRPSSTRLERLAPSAVLVASLLRHVCSFERTREEAERAFAFVERVLATTPVFSLERHLSDDLGAIVAKIEAQLGHIPTET